jgi:hypothetical protein
MLTYADVCYIADISIAATEKRMLTYADVC